MIGRVLQRARGELWALTALLLLLVLLCTHLGNTVPKELKNTTEGTGLEKNNKTLIFLCQFCSFSLIQWKAFYLCMRPLCHRCPYCVGR